MAITIVLLFCIGVYYYVGRKSIARLLSLIIIISLLFYCFIVGPQFYDTNHLLHALWVIVTIGAIVLPWKGFKNIKRIESINSKKIENVSNVLIYICLVLNVVCLVIGFYVFSSIKDINAFKYVDGTQDFYGSLGIDLHGLTLAVLLYPLGYLLIPFVFYYLSQNRKKKAIFCFVGSLLPLLYGLTYFSRAHMVHFALIYVAAYFLLKDSIAKHYENSIRKALLIAGAIMTISFASISISRFNDKSYMSSSGEIIDEDTALKSSLDYICMWWHNSELIFDRFEGETFHNEILFSQIHQFFYITTFGRVKSNSQKIADDRVLLLKDKSNSFIGVSGYTLYDQGPILGVILYILYGFFVRRLKPVKGRINIKSLMFVFILIQYPLYSIFYSMMSTIMLLLMYMLPIYFYLDRETLNN